MSIATELRALEQQLLQPGFRCNRTAVAALLADDFREFGSSGRVWNKQQILNRLETEPPFQAEMNDFQATELVSEVVLVTYIVAIQLSDSGTRTSLRSSIWIKHDDRWQITFHQGTLISKIGRNI